MNRYAILLASAAILSAPSSHALDIYVPGNQCDINGDDGGLTWQPLYVKSPSHGMVWTAGSSANPNTVVCPIPVHGTIGANWEVSVRVHDGNSYAGGDVTCSFFTQDINGTNFASIVSKTTSGAPGYTTLTLPKLVVSGQNYAQVYCSFPQAKTPSGQPYQFGVRNIYVKNY